MDHLAFRSWNTFDSQIGSAKPRNEFSNCFLPLNDGNDIPRWPRLTLESAAAEIASEQGVCVHL